METFTTYLSNGKSVELCPGGADKAVTHENYKEFIELLIQARLNESSRQMEWLREGVQYVIPLSVL